MTREAYAFSQPQPDGAPTGWRLVRFSAIAIPASAAALPIGVYLPTIFARDFGLSLGSIGLVFLLGRLWDAVTDPVVGALSDRTRSRFGRRKPWIAAGGALFLAAALFLFFPAAGVTPLYLGVVLFFFYRGWTAMQIPFLAWSGEISGQYHQRTRIATYQTVVGAAALFVTLVLPAIADQIRPGDGRLQLALMGALVLTATVPALLLTLTSFPEAQPQHVEAPFSLGESLRAVFSNPLLLRVLASDSGLR